MALILLGTVLSGVIFSKMLLAAGLHHVISRFVIVLVLAYVSFFILMKLWLLYLTTSYRKSKIGENLLDAADAATDILEFPSADSLPHAAGHGGGFGGAGASGAWADAGVTPDLPGSDTVTEAASSAVESVTEAAGEALTGTTEEGGILLLPLIILLLVIFGGGIYLIYEAPVIMSEAAFELILATTLVKKAWAMDAPGWMGSVFRATWPAFALTLVITIIAGWALTAYCPPGY